MPQSCCGDESGFPFDFLQCKLCPCEVVLCAETAIEALIVAIVRYIQRCVELNRFAEMPQGRLMRLLAKGYPVRGLRELWRVLKPGGQLLMFEHVRSNVPMVGLMLDALTYISRLIGPDLNRDTATNVRRASFEILRERNVYFDIMRTIEEVKPPERT